MKRWRIVRDPVHQAGRTFVLAFFLTFTILGVLLTMQAVRVFHGIDQRALDTHTRAVPLAYLTGAVRRADATGGVGIAFLPDGEQALRTRENGHTWLYVCRNGYLYKQGYGRDADTAERLCRAGTMRLRWLGGTICVDYTAPDGGKATLLLCQRGIGGTA